MRYEIKYLVNNKKYTNESEFLDIEVTETLEIILHPKTKIDLVSARMFLPYDRTKTFYLNGYQSWSVSGEYKRGDKTPHLTLLGRFANLLFNVKVMGDYNFVKQDKYISHTYTYIKDEDKYLFYGAINERSGFTTFHFNKELEIHKDIEGKSITEDFILFDIYKKETKTLDEAISSYCDKLNITKKEVPLLLGYTSWYRHYQDISEEKLTNDLQGLIDHKKDYPAELFQIDDGYQTFVGDWLDIDKEKFPHGLEPVINKIKSQGYLPGLWLAPIIAEKNSRIRKEHPDWILCKGTLNWSGMYHLNIQKEEVRNYLHEVFTHYKNMGIKFFKLDFLYAACTKPMNNKTRAEIMYETIDFFKEELKDCYILGCGVPLSSTFGKFDYCRIGSDITFPYIGPFKTRYLYKEIMSTKYAIQNTLARYHLDQKVFGNDSDVFVLRKTSLTEEERLRLYDVNINHTSLFLHSDDMNEYTKEDLKLLEQIKTIVEEKSRK